MGKVIQRADTLLCQLCRNIAGLFALVACFAVSPALAFSECDNIKATVDIADVKRDIETIIPLRYFLQLRATEFTIEQQSTHFGPYSEAGQKPRTFGIRVPALFLANQCKLSMLTFTANFSDREVDWRDKFESDFKVCVEKTGEVQQCFSTGLDEAAERVRPQYEGIAPSLKHVGAIFVRDAIMTLILHEVSHIVLGHIGRAPQADDEYKADVFALFYGNVVGALPQAAKDIFSQYTLLDPYIDNGAGLHGSYFCRFMTTWFITRDLGMAPAMLLGLVNDGRVPEKEARGAIGTELATLPRSTDYMSVFRLACPVVKQPQIRNVADDIARVGKVLQANLPEIDAISAGGDPTKLVMDLLSVRVISAEGRSFVSRVAVAIVRKATMRWKRPQWRLPTISKLASEILKRDPDRNINAQAYGTLVGTAAMNDYYVQADGLTPAATLTMFEPRFKEAVAYNDAFAEAFLMWGMLKIENGSCDEGLQIYAEGVRRVPDLHREVPQKFLDAFRMGIETRGCAAMAEFVPLAIGRRGAPGQP